MSKIFMVISFFGIVGTAAYLAMYPLIVEILNQLALNAQNISKVIVR